MTADHINDEYRWDSIQNRYIYPGYPWSSSSSILSGLVTREVHGRTRRSDPVSPGTIPKVLSPVAWNTDCLASIAAWNPKRMQNMILSVGPGTPASLVFSSMGEKDDSSEVSQSITIVGDDEDDEGESHGGSSLFIDFSSSSLLRFARSLGRLDERKDGEEDTVDDDSTEEDKDYTSTRRQEEDYEESINDRQSKDEHPKDSSSTTTINHDAYDSDRPKRMKRTRAREDLSTTSSDIQSIHHRPTSSTFIERNLHHPSIRSRVHDSASMKHDGCINAAMWLSGSWRLSTAHTEETYNQDNAFVFSSSHSSNSHAGRFVNARPVEMMESECPTQIATSGDDRLVKFWDVQSSMGMALPETCFTPFSSSYPADGVGSSIIKSWRKKYKQGYILPGIVHPIATIKTGHHGNVFYLTPINEKPGKVLTCGADGFLLLSDIELQSSTLSAWTASTVVVSPNTTDDMRNLGNASLLGLGEMCYSHVMIDANTGLLCGSEGLHRFDIRLPSHSQPSRSILGNMPCKACALWPVSETFRRTNLTDSSYVFAGGSGATVHLYDLRYIADRDCKVIESYTPTNLQNCNNVSVSGIDVSRDKQELLVSYENDVIYTFSVLAGIKSSAGPTLDEIDERTRSSNEVCIRDMTSYGAHLNRLTFLKCAKYAGPTDEYICTGSDSGHAFIYDKATGYVASLLKADETTCNGVVPHPTLPFFLTYGIDSTAKLWRATIPVNNDLDDSANGRCKHLHKKKYQKSNIIKDWKVSKTNAVMSFDLDDKKVQIFPDDFPAEDVMTETDFMLGSFSRFILRALSSENKSLKIRNDLQNLPLILSQNLSACIRAHRDGDDLPIQSLLSDLKNRISLMRIRHQLDQLGYTWSVSLNPLDFLLNEVRKYGFPNYRQNLDNNINLDYPLLPDLIPEHPSDWYPYDSRFSTEPLSFGNKMSTDTVFCDSLHHYRYNRWESFNDLMVARRKEEATDNDTKHETAHQDAFRFLSDIVSLLKDYGNLALANGEVNLSAKYYDKAIRFCSSIYMPFAHGSSQFLSDHHGIILSNGGYYTEWSTFLKLFLSIRLNLSAVMMKSEISDYDCASKQAQLVIDSLKPFATTEGKVLSGPKLESYRDDEPVDTYIEANTMKAKAYFRLGNAKFLMDDYSSAVRSFESSIKATRAAHLQPEGVVVRRLNEARAAKSRKSEG